MKHRIPEIAIALCILLVIVLFAGAFLVKSTSSKTVDNARFTAYKLDNAVNIAGDSKGWSGYILIDNETEVEYFCTTAITKDGRTISSMCPLYNSDGTICTATNSPDNTLKEQ